MALFGILRGPSSRMTNNTPPFHDGYCYYETDTGKFWIDAKDESNQEIRRCINEGGEAFQETLYAANWRGSIYDLTGLSKVKADTNGVVGVAQEATDEQYDAAKFAAIRLTEQGNGTMRFVATSGKPELDIPITIIIFR